LPSPKKGSSNPQAETKAEAETEARQKDLLDEKA
jgi:hypothetical protein